MKTLVILNITAVINLLIFSSCRNSQPNEKSADRDVVSVSDSDNAKSNSVELTEEQARTAHIMTGALVHKKMSQKITANGTLALQPDHFATVTTAADGYVDRIYFQEGDIVKKGKILATLRHPHYVQLQQDFLEAGAKFEYLQKELNRQKTLSEANVSAQKQYQQTQADYETARARYLAAMEQLKFSGISPDSVKAGIITDTINLKAPISGNISQINIHKGELLSPQQTAFEIVDNSYLLAHLQIFEKDINNIHTGESFIFTIPAFGDSVNYRGIITGSDRVLDQESKTMEVIGTVENNPVLMTGLYIEARINMSEKVVYALPEEAVARGQNEEFIFVYNSRPAESSYDSIRLYNKIKVTTGLKDGGFIQIVTPDSLMNNKNIVLSGTYYLNAEMNKGEGDED